MGAAAYSLTTEGTEAQSVYVLSAPAPLWQTFDQELSHHRGY
jgi:hypothetical protein